MRTLRVCLVLALAVGASLPHPGRAVAKNASTTAVVALIDSGINPYSKAFRDASPLARRHPSAYIPGYPKEAQPLRLSLDLPYEKAIEADKDAWSGVRTGTLYWIPGTRIIGAISFGAGGTYCPTIAVPPVGGSTNSGCSEHRILDDFGHGSMTASRAAGSPHSLAPEARIVAIEGLGSKSVRWAADAGWIDVQSNSWLSLIPPPLPDDVPEAFWYASTRTLTLAASGNGTAYLTGFAPTPTYVLSTAPPGVVLIGAHDNGQMALWSGAPPHLVADGYAGYTAIVRSSEKMRPDPMACCTSAASPYAAGGAAALVLEARRILGDTRTGIREEVVAEGPRGRVPSGPLEDGKFTLDELKDLLFHTAEPHPSEGRDDGDVHWAGAPRAPDHVEFGPGANPFCFGCTTTPVPWSSVPEAVDAYQFIGYGGINEHSVGLAVSVLRGKEDPLARPTADAQYQLDQELRHAIFSANEP